MTGAIDELLRGIGEKCAILGRNELREFQRDPVGYVRTAARDLQRLGIVDDAALKKLGIRPIAPTSTLAPGPVTPVDGSVLYTDLVGQYAQHSGIYVGRGKIVELNGQGRIVLVSPQEFTNGRVGHDIFVSCRNGKAVGSPQAAQRARECLGAKRNYHVLLDNCHQFISGCLSGDFENADNLLTLLKNSTERQLQSNEWRVLHRLNSR